MSTEPRLELPDGSMFELPEGLTTVGRESACDIQLDRPEVSRRALAVIRRGETVLASSLASKNPARVDGDELHEHELQDQEQIKIAGVVLTFHAPDLQLAPMPVPPARKPPSPDETVPMPTEAEAAEEAPPAVIAPLAEPAVAVSGGLPLPLPALIGLAAGGLLLVVVVILLAAGALGGAGAGSSSSALAAGSSESASQPFSLPPIPSSSAAPSSSSAVSSEPAASSSARQADPAMLRRIGAALERAAAAGLAEVDEAKRQLQLARAMLNLEPESDPEVLALDRRLTEIASSLVASTAERDRVREQIDRAKAALEAAVKTEDAARLRAAAEALRTLIHSAEGLRHAERGVHRDCRALLTLATRKQNLLAAAARERSLRAAIAEVARIELLIVKDKLDAARKAIKACQARFKALRAAGPVRHLVFDEAELRLGQLAAVLDQRVAFTEEDLDRAIRRGQAALINLQRHDGSWRRVGDEDAGTTALALLALLKSGVKPRKPAIVKGLRLLLSRGTPPKVYEASLVCMLMEALSEARGRRIKPRRGPTRELSKALKLSKDERLLFTRSAEGLARSMHEGAFGYRIKAPDVEDGETSIDHSNTQYGILGLRAASHCGLRFPRLWNPVLRHFRENQKRPDLSASALRLLPPGQRLKGSFIPRGWTYRQPERGPATLNMTCVGVAAILIGLEQLELVGGEVENREAAAQALHDGLTWVSGRVQDGLKGDRGGLHGYTLYSIERVGALTGRRHLGGLDWYLHGAKLYLDTQEPQSGRWKGQYNAVVETAFALLFLKRGTAPMVVTITESSADYEPKTTK